jgi:hypothetical protein
LTCPDDILDRYSVYSSSSHCGLGLIHSGRDPTLPEPRSRPGDHTAAARLQETYVARLAGSGLQTERIVAELAQERRQR